MNNKNQKTLKAVFGDPINGNIEWRKIESLFLSLGAVRTERAGSAVSFILNDIRVDFHRPHPDKAALRYRVKDARRFLEQAGINTMNMMKHKGYTALIESDENDRVFVGHLAGIKDIVGFHGTTADELENVFHESVDSYVSINAETGRAAQKPYSGKLMLRVSPDIHAAVGHCCSNTWQEHKSMGL